MTPVQYVPINFTNPIEVFEINNGFIVLDERGEDVTKDYNIEIRKAGQTETVLVSKK